MNPSNDLKIIIKHYSEHQLTPNLTLSLHNVLGCLLTDIDIGCKLSTGPGF